MSNSCIFIDKHCHLFSQCWWPWTTFTLHGITIHSNFEASFKTTCTTLIAVCLIDHTKSIGFRFANILSITAYWTFEESSTTITCINSVVLTGAMITAYLTWNVIQYATWEDEIKKLVGIIKSILFIFFFWNLMPFLCGLLCFRGFVHAQHPELFILTWMNGINLKWAKIDRDMNKSIRLLFQAMLRNRRKWKWKELLAQEMEFARLWFFVWDFLNDGSFLMLENRLMCDAHFCEFFCRLDELQKRVDAYWEFLVGILKYEFLRVSWGHFWDLMK